MSVHRMRHENTSMLGPCTPMNEALQLVDEFAGMHLEDTDEMPAPASKAWLWSVALRRAYD